MRCIKQLVHIIMQFVHKVEWPREINKEVVKKSFKKLMSTQTASVLFIRLPPLKLMHYKNCQPGPFEKKRLGFCMFVHSDICPQPLLLLR